MRVNLRPLLLIGFLVLPSLAQADPIGFSFFGTVTRINNGNATELPDYGISLGTPITGVVTWDPDFMFRTPTSTEIYQTDHPGSAVLTASVGSLALSSILFYTLVSRTSDSVSWAFQYEASASNAIPPQFVTNAFVILTSSRPSEVPAGAAILESFDPTLWDGGSVGIHGDLCPPGCPPFVIEGTISHTDSVPEPSSLLLGVLGAASASAARFRRSRSRSQVSRRS
jgi:hypothetical protein